MNDELMRQLAILSFLALVVLALVGGYVQNVSGEWYDGERRVTLRQTGFLLKGGCAQSHGQQLFSGTVFFGRVKLWRYDFGHPHLMAMGFNPDQAKRLEGARTGQFRFRLQGADILVGHFCGTHFFFDSHQVKDRGLSAPSSRRWTRQPAKPSA